MRASLNRRAVLQSGALAAGALALSGGAWSGSAQAGNVPVAGEADRPIAGRLTAWLAIDFDRGARLRLVELETTSHTPREIVAAQLPAGSVMTAASEANLTALAAVAQSWRVAPADCAIGHGCIVHRPSGRSVPYGVWADFV